MSDKHDHPVGGQPDLTIIIVNYNVKEFLANCLQSVMRATGGQHWGAGQRATGGQHRGAGQKATDGEQDGAGEQVGQQADQQQGNSPKSESDPVRTLQTEIFVIDNASSDQSVEFLTPRFPSVTFIQNDKNVGFGKANNQAISQARGRYTLLLNPDTLLQEDTLRTLTDFMDRHPEAGACGCKILNPDGSFAAESRRSVPNVSSAFYKAAGLTALFPKHRRFGRYYLGWLDEDEQAEIPVLSGSFMFFRTKVLQEAGGFDERFFMYGEDIDLCYRVQQAGHKLVYVPDTSIIHYKGESSKRDDFTYNKVFNDALFLFFDKHYTSRYSKFFKWGVWLAVKIRTLATFTLAKLRGIREVGIDLILLNLSLFVALGIRIGFDPNRLFSTDNLSFLWLNLLLSLLYLLFAQTSGLLKSNKDSLPESLKTVLLSFISLVVLTFFLRDLAFSRIIIAVAALIALMGVLTVRLIRINRKRRPGQSEGKVKPTRVLLVGTGPGTDQMVDNLNSRAHWHAEITGILGDKQQLAEQLAENHHLDREHQLNNPPPYLGSTIHIERIVRETNTNLVIFLMESVTHTELIECVRRLKDLDVDTKIVPDQMNFMIGKADVEYLDELPLIRLDLPYFHSLQRLLKRSFDLALSSLLLGLMLPLVPVLVAARAKGTRRDVIVWDGKKEHRIGLFVSAGGVEGEEDSLAVVRGRSPDQRANQRANHWANRWRILRAIWLGRLSFVGAPVPVHHQGGNFGRRESEIVAGSEVVTRNKDVVSTVDKVEISQEEKSTNGDAVHEGSVQVGGNGDMKFRTGLTGYAQLNRSRIRRERDREQFDLYYLQNYSLWLDVDILLKSLVRGNTLLTELSKQTNLAKQTNHAKQVDSTT